MNRNVTRALIILIIILLMAGIWWSFNREGGSDSSARGVLYENETLGFRVMLPEEWEGQYSVQENEDGSVDYFRTVPDGVGGSEPAFVFRIQALPLEERSSLQASCIRIREEAGNIPEPAPLTEDQVVQGGEGTENPMLAAENYALSQEALFHCDIQEKAIVGENGRFAFQFVPLIGTGWGHDPQSGEALLASHLKGTFEAIE